MRDRRRRIDDLLLARATARPSSAEAAELERLLAQHSGVDAEVYERAAAAVCLAVLDTHEPMPAPLRAKIEQQAATFLSSAAPPRR